MWYNMRGRIINMGGHMNKKDIEIVENLYKHYVRKAISFAMTYVHDKVFFFNDF